MITAAEVRDEMDKDLISRKAAIRWVKTECNPYGKPTLEFESGKKVIEHLEQMPSVQPEDYTELKREFLRMASYIDVLLECSDEQKETLIGFISRLAEFMPWTERD